MNNHTELYRYTVLLTEHITGFLYANIAPEIGDTVTVQVYSENDVPYNVTGIVADLLDPGPFCTCHYSR